VASRARPEQLELFPNDRKLCSTCGEVKPLSSFHRKRAARDGLQSMCKPCNIEQAKRFHAENLDHCRKRIGDWMRRVDTANKERVLEVLLANPCVDCGEDDPVVLEFDHQGDKVFTVASALHWHVRWEVIAEEIDKCEVRCANCHRRRHAEEAGWFRAVAMRARDRG
jgi:hypothetical protein